MSSLADQRRRNEEHLAELARLERAARQAALALYLGTFVIAVTAWAVVGWLFENAGGLP